MIDRVSTTKLQIAILEHEDPNEHILWKRGARHDTACSGMLVPPKAGIGQHKRVICEQKDVEGGSNCSATWDSDRRWRVSWRCDSGHRSADNRSKKASPTSNKKTRNHGCVSLAYGCAPYGVF